MNTCGHMLYDVWLAKEVNHNLLLLNAITELFDALHVIKPGKNCLRSLLKCSGKKVCKSLTNSVNYYK